jgi:hypothetical protein
MPLMLLMVLLLWSTDVYSLTSIIASSWHTSRLGYLTPYVLNVWYVIEALHTLNTADELLEVLSIDWYLLPGIIVVVLLLGTAILLTC